METALTGILAIDIGGSHIKMTVLDANGNLQKDYKKVITPMPATPDNVIAAIKNLEKDFSGYGMISAGFPGYVKNGVVLTAPNLGTAEWQHVNLEKLLSDAFGKPAKVVNDADMQGLGIVSGTGFEIVLTLGTGFGSAMFMNGKLLPHFELSHHPISKNKIYDEYIGEKALEAEGVKKWNKRFQKILAVLKTVFNYDMLYIGGGNGAKLDLQPEDNIKIVSNRDGIQGGAKLWEQ